ncbi:sugar phosphate isomerase/epimerase [Bacillus sp. FJAT-50079]|uniref:sugar phosphate isomerase/epimerase family protein n=1 Tax=Bacillus sp. FJAT-50079 TaxID=2833577 RepID=UPI001BC99822|nr:sugar phosphate isomerase/epimerase [Bacillus sp. FJAT-50079]MBS4208119.1 sugar phosphate isomerase/epimerase [Bacillus sp. FJAT-50079]
MKTGLSTYAFFWKFNSLEKDSESLLSLAEMIEETKRLGGEVFQICDYPILEEMSEEELINVKTLAHRLGIEIELGTRGVHPKHLRKYLDYCKLFEAKVLRTMINDKQYTPSIEQAVAWIEEVLPLYVEAEVSIALENYEQVQTDDLLTLVQRFDHQNIGICLDPANSVAALEMPKDVIKKLAPYVISLHVKDFVFTRKEGWIGFSYIGCPLGEGQLDLEFLLQSLRQAGRSPNAIIELWLPFTKTREQTNRLENEWIIKSMAYLQTFLTNKY